MLPRQHRLRSAAAIRRVRQQGRAWRHPLAILIMVRAIEPEALAGTRFCISASRHVGNAVVRNRAKRLLRDAVRHHLADIESGCDCLLIARPFTAKATLAEVETAVLQLLSRARLLVPPSVAVEQQGEA